MKNTSFFVIPLILIGFVFAGQAGAAETKDGAFKAVVKVKTYQLDDDYRITETAEGSGVIIDPSGIVLTNHHVVLEEDSFNNKMKDAGYHVCLTVDSSKEPDCSYTAKLIRYNKDLDMAMLKIQVVPKVSEMITFPYLELALDASASSSSEITALGYPNIGEDTITITRGIESGRSEKHNKKWIKTDAVTSFGNSGGAAIDSNGKLIGITTRAYSDMLGSIGYILNILSVNDWISQYKGASPRDNSIFQKVSDLARKQKILKQSNKYISTYPPFSIEKPAGWDFTHEGESVVFIDKESDEDGGYVTVESLYMGHATDFSEIIPMIRRNAAGKAMIGLISIETKPDVSIGSQKGKVILVRTGNEQDLGYYFVNRDYLIKISFDYGKDDKDKAIVESVIKSLRITKINKAVAEERQHKNAAPDFKAKTAGDWFVRKINSSQNPVQFLNKKNKDVYAEITFEKIDSKNSYPNIEAYLNEMKRKIAQANGASGLLNLKLEVLESKTKYKLNNELKDMAVLKSMLKSADKNKAIVYETVLIKKVGNSYMLINLTSLTDKKSVHDKNFADFVKTMQNFSLK